MLTWKHSQYFFKQWDFLHWHPLLCRTPPSAVPPVAGRLHVAIVVVVVVVTSHSTDGALAAALAAAAAMEEVPAAHAWPLAACAVFLVTSALVDLGPERIRVPLELRACSMLSERERW